MGAWWWTLTCTLSRSYCEHIFIGLYLLCALSNSQSSLSPELPCLCSYHCCFSRPGKTSVFRDCLITFVLSLSILLLLFDSQYCLWRVRHFRPPLSLYLSLSLSLSPKVTTYFLYHSSSLRVEWVSHSLSLKHSLSECWMLRPADCKYLSQERETLGWCRELGWSTGLRNVCSSYFFSFQSSSYKFSVWIFQKLTLRIWTHCMDNSSKLYFFIKV